MKSYGCNTSKALIPFNLVGVIALLLFFPFTGVRWS